MQKEENPKNFPTYEFVHTAEEQVDHVQLSIPFQPQGQGTIVKRNIRWNEIDDFADYIKHNTDWLKLWKICHCIIHDEGLSHRGGDNFIRSGIFERAVTKCIRRATYVNKHYDIDVIEDPVELKIGKDLYRPRKKIIELTVKNDRPSGNKKNKEQEEEAFARWIESDRYRFIIIIDYYTRRVFVTSQDAVKNNSINGNSGIVVKLPMSDMREIHYQNLLPEFYDSGFDNKEIPYSNFWDYANEAFLSQF